MLLKLVLPKQNMLRNEEGLAGKRLMKLCRQRKKAKFCSASKEVDILEAYEGTLDDNHPRENECCEHGEMLLYKISLLEEFSLIEKALEELHRKKSKIVDKFSHKEVEVSLLVKLGWLEEGEKLYRLLVSMNPDNYRYYEGLHTCLGLHFENAQYSSNEVDQLEALYKSLALQYSWSSAAKAPAMQLECMTNYLAELALLEYHMLHYAPSLIAASTIFLARYMLFPSRRPWNSTLLHYTLYKPSDMLECVTALHSLCRDNLNCCLPAIREKYSTHKYKCVTKKFCPPSIPREYFQDL